MFSEPICRGGKGRKFFFFFFFWANLAVKSGCGDRQVFGVARGLQDTLLGDVGRRGGGNDALATQEIPFFPDTSLTKRQKKTSPDGALFNVFV